MVLNLYIAILSTIVLVLFDNLNKCSNINIVLLFSIFFKYCPVRNY